MLDTLAGANFAVYVPPVTKLYVVKNNSAYVATVYCSTVLGNTTAAGTGVAIPAGKSVLLRSDSTNIIEQLNQVVGDFAVGGTLAVAGSLTVAGTGAFTGVVSGPTAAPGTSTTQLATTNFTTTAITAATAPLAPLASPAFTGTPTAPTAAQGTNNTQLATTAYVQANGVPTGMVMAFANSTAPVGWLECAGAAVSRTTYAALFSAIGTVYGAGDGSTTFNVPDLRGQFLRGWSNGSSIDSGRSIGTSQTDAMQGHYHEYWAAGIATTNNNTDSRTPHVGIPPSQQTGSNLQAVRSPMTDGSNGTPRTAAETRPTNVAMMYCIKT